MRLMLALLVLAVAACQTVVPVPAPSSPANPTTPPSPTVKETQSLSPTPTPTLGAAVTDDAGGWNFTRSPDWVVAKPAAYDPLQGGVTLFISNFPLKPECVVGASATQAPGTLPPACLVPFSSIPAGGVYIETYGSRTISEIPNGGEPIEVMGRPSRLELDRPGRCATQVTDEVLKVPIPDGENVYHVSVIACLMGPGVDQTERQFRAFLASLTSQQ